jgi:hypothetical protein
MRQERIEQLYEKYLSIMKKCMEDSKSPKESRKFILSVADDAIDLLNEVEVRGAEIKFLEEEMNKMMKKTGKEDGKVTGPVVDLSKKKSQEEIKKDKKGK